MFEINIKLNSDPMSGAEWFKALIPIIAAVIASIGAFVGAGIAAVLAIRAYRTNQWWDTRNKVYQKAVETLDEGVQAGVFYLAAFKREASDRSDYGRVIDWLVDYELPKSEADLERLGVDRELKSALKLMIRTRLSETRFNEAWEKIRALASQGRFNMSRIARKELIITIAEIQQLMSDSELKGELKINRVTDRLEAGLHSFSNAAKRDLNVIPWSAYLKLWSYNLRILLNAGRRQLVRAAFIVWWGYEKGRKRYRSMCHRIRSRHANMKTK